MNTNTIAGKGNEDIHVELAILVFLRYSIDLRYFFMSWVVAHPITQD